MRGFAKVIILVPLALLAVAFAVGNRSDVSLTFDPFSDQPYTVDVPLFVVVFAALILGVLLGGIGTWLGQGRHRKAARMHRRDVERLRSDLDRLQGTS
jgi:uncharacterized integral membrane protein